MLESLNYELEQETIDHLPYYSDYTKLDQILTPEQQINNILDWKRVNYQQ